MTDPFKSYARSLTAPPEHGAAVTPDDAAGPAAAPPRLDPIRTPITVPIQERMS
jgi:hypothetical protein